MPQEYRLILKNADVPGYTVLHALTANFTLRTLGSALLLVMIVYMPLSLFERSSARHFIADTYAPLVVGEAGQLRTASWSRDVDRDDFGIDRLDRRVAWEGDASKTRRCGSGCGASGQGHG